LRLTGAELGGNPANGKISCNGGGGATAGEIPVFRCVADQLIDARAQTKDSPRRTFGYAVKPANESLVTDVSRLRPHRCTIIASTTSRANRGEAGTLHLRA
jgi:hypothetical protein